MCVHAQLCPTLCNQMEGSPPDSSVQGIFQARRLGQVAISFFKGSSWPRDWTHISLLSCVGRWILYHYATWEAQNSQCSLILQVRKLSSESWSHLLKGHINAKWQTWDVTSDASDFRAILFLLHDTLWIEANWDLKRLFFLSLQNVLSPRERPNFTHVSSWLSYSASFIKCTLTFYIIE